MRTTVFPEGTTLWRDRPVQPLRRGSRQIGTPLPSGKHRLSVKTCGEGGIRTHGTHRAHTISSRADSTTLAPLQLFRQRSKGLMKLTKQNVSISKIRAKGTHEFSRLSGTNSTTLAAPSVPSGHLSNSFYKDQKNN